MNIAARACGIRGPLRTTALLCAGLMSGAALLLAGCSQAGPAGSQASAGTAVAAPAAGAPHAPVPGPASGSSAASSAARLALASPSIIFIASLTFRTANVTAAASRATGIALREGGYVSSEQARIDPADHARSTVSLQLKVPVAAYDTTLATLSAVLGTQTSLTQHAQDVTQQVADVGSLVTSAQAAITQLQALLKRAGSVSALLTVQEQINAQESSLEALQAQQRALTQETSYATVSVTLVGPPHHRGAAAARNRRHGFLAGLAAGWRGLRIAGSAVLTALGAVLPFAVVAAALAGAAYAGRRWLRRLLRRGSRPTTAG
jgi:Domain of unknown function (DUF4349)